MNIDTTTTRDLRNDRQLKLIGLVVVCAPLWWVMGLNLFVYHLTALFVFAFLIVETGYDNRRQPVPAVAWILLAISVIYGASILFNAPSHDFMRIVASANNLSYWIMAAMLIAVIAVRFRVRHIAGLLRIFPLLGAFNLIIAVVALVIVSRGVQALSIATPLSRLTAILGDTALVEYSVQVRLITEDYFSERTVPRFNLYAPYPTAAGAFFMISIPLLVAWGIHSKRWSSPWFWALLVGNFLCLAMTLARMAVVALVASAVLVFVLQKRNVVAWGMLFVVAGVLAMPFLIQKGSDVVAAREGSSLSRFALYRDSVDQLHDVDWVLGLGVRTYSEKHRMPYGSHSTYISLLYRTGVAGLATFMLLQTVLFVRWYRLKEYARANPEYFLLWLALGIVFLSMAFWMMTEDIDVPQLLAFMYFAAIGVFEGLRRELVTSPARIDSWESLSGSAIVRNTAIGHGLWQNDAHRYGGSR